MGITTMYGIDCGNGLWFDFSSHREQFALSLTYDRAMAEYYAGDDKVVVFDVKEVSRYQGKKPPLPDMELSNE